MPRSAAQNLPSESSKRVPRGIESPRISGRWSRKALPDGMALSPAGMYSVRITRHSEKALGSDAGRIAPEIRRSEKSGTSCRLVTAKTAAALGSRATRSELPQTAVDGREEAFERCTSRRRSTQSRSRHFPDLRLWSASGLSPSFPNDKCVGRTLGITATCVLLTECPCRPCPCGTGRPMCLQTDLM